MVNVSPLDISLKKLSSLIMNGDIPMDDLEYSFIILQTVVIDCLAYIIPLNTVDRDSSLNGDYQKSAQKVTKVLMESLPDCVEYLKSHSLEIVEHLLANTWDETHFESLFGTRINYIAENHAIKHQTFSDSLIYIQVSFLVENAFSISS